MPLISCPASSVEISDSAGPYISWSGLLLELEGTTLFGSLTLFFLSETLRSLVIELSLPPSGDKTPWKQVFTPSCSDATGCWLWRLAKARVIAHDAGYLQLVIHWWNHREHFLSREMAIEDPTAKHGLKLTIKDYPFPNDGRILWAAVKQCVSDYVDHDYPETSMVKSDKELQAWWTEVRARRMNHGCLS
uniref:Lipoxygenase domain-containing protein n=1 Tax=Salix viminalis TaxID=40686 RepID=A0A6N2KI14_SALVM